MLSTFETAASSRNIYTESLDRDHWQSLCQLLLSDDEVSHNLRPILCVFEIVCVGNVPTILIQRGDGAQMPIFPPAASSPDENLPRLLDKVTKLRLQLQLIYHICSSDDQQIISTERTFNVTIFHYNDMNNQIKVDATQAFRPNPARLLPGTCCHPSLVSCQGLVAIRAWFLARD